VTSYDGRRNAIPPPPRPIEHRGADASGWWISLLVGVLLVGLGVWMLTNLFESVVVLAWIAGVALILGGVVEVTALGGRKALGWLAWLAALLMIGAGVVVLVWPGITLWALALLAGATLMGAGLIRIVMAFYNRNDDPGWTLDVGIGGLGVALGAVVMVWPGATLVVLAVSLGIRAIATGLIALGAGWQMHRLAA
jgi:uncharacterized membrane protein HdeD (DUF308 family)